MHRVAIPITPGLPLFELAAACEVFGSRQDFPVPWWYEVQLCGVQDGTAQGRYDVVTVAGFVGVPRVPAPMLEKVRDGLAAYIRKNKLDHPVIVGHSLGGFLAGMLLVKVMGTRERYYRPRNLYQ